MTAEVQANEKQYPRFRLGARIEHFVLMLSFTVLGVTGLPQMFAESMLAQDLINLMGGIEFIRIVHRWAAAVLILGSVYHLLTSSYRFFVKHERMGMVPDRKDAEDLRDYVLYNLGRRDEHPKMRKFNFGEKFEYWAVVWGTAVMILTGFMLLNPIATTSVLPGEVIPVALAAHGNEALLAVLAIIIWHMYNVHIKHFNPSIFTGKMPRDQMKEEHALELERLEAGEKPWPELDLPTRRRRQRIYLAVATVVGIIAVVIVVWMFTFEQTAVTTVLPTATPLP
ncbi:MAG: cytochrome b/b6 domain-containing protein [Candidatus Promineifilaceae bacterium]|nr:cytochrome b/b6 domain-containing protein [Candidatus Promineifilaceae bacterium]